MEAVLPRGRIRVTGVIENVAWRERHEAQKRARAARVEDPAKKARIEARQQAKEARKAEREARKQARIQERIRTQMLRETYKQLGIEEGYVGNKQSQIDAARSNNPNAPAGSLGRLRTQEQVALGAGGAAAADQREMRGLGKDIAVTAGTAAIAAAGGLEAVATPIIGAAAYEAIMGVVASITGSTLFIPAVAICSVAILAKKLIKKAKARRANQADQAQKLDGWQEELDNFKKQLEAVQGQLSIDQEMMVQKYQSMKKGEFNAFLKEYISSLLQSSGLIADGAAKSQAVQEISQEIEASAAGAAKEEKEPEAEEETEKGEGEPEAEAEDAPEQETEQPEEAPTSQNPDGPVVEEPEMDGGSAPDAPEEVAPNIQEPGMDEPSMPTVQEVEAPTIEKPEVAESAAPANAESEMAEPEMGEVEAPSVSSISLEEIAAAKEEMMSEGLIENPAEKEAQIQAQIRHMQEEKAKADHSIEMDGSNRTM